MAIFSPESLRSGCHGYWQGLSHRRKRVDLHRAFTQVHGRRVCPHGWKGGTDAYKTDGNRMLPFLIGEAVWSTPPQCLGPGRARWKVRSRCDSGAPCSIASRPRLQGPPGKGRTGDGNQAPAGVRCTELRIQELAFAEGDRGRSVLSAACAVVRAPTRGRPIGRTGRVAERSARLHRASRRVSPGVALGKSAVLVVVALGSR